MWKSCTRVLLTMKTSTMTKILIKSESRSNTPWTNVANATPLQKGLDKAVKTTYEFKHKPILNKSELNIFNSVVITKCRYCGCNSFIKNGKTPDGLQKYKCKNCFKTFTIITHTIFDSHKIPLSEWVDFLRNIFSFQSFDSTSRNNGNSINTTRYWISKVFLTLRGYQDNILFTGTIELDETYYNAIKADIQYKENGKKYRGLSRNKYCIGVMLNEEGKVFCFNQGLKGKPSIKSTLDCFKDHIEYGSTLIHDAELSHRKLVEVLGLKEEVYFTNEIKYLKDSDNPLFRINKVHFLLKKFLNAHCGFNREHLQDYLNLFSFIINTPSSYIEKIEIFLKLVFENSILLRYRDKMPK